MHLFRKHVIAFSAAVLVTSAGLTACGSDDAAATHNDTDGLFISAMAMHHERAIEVGQLAANKGSDARVRDFGRLIVSQQSPELKALRGWSSEVPAPPNVDMGMPDGYVTDAELARLRGETGVTFDRDVLLASASSETGAAAMAQRELASGIYDPARTLATSIATAPTTQIPKLHELAAQLPG
ncbi:DUF305 domain-containing protein [Williamsia phyllosphaerae]|nr:DUF305 domain-containing protein [Williamsia phyllosphaerae]